MRTLCSLALAIWVLSAGVYASDPQTQSAPTMEQLARKLDLERESDGERGSVAVPRAEKSMLDGMVILVDARHWTVVPANSVLSAPPRYASYVGGDANGKKYLQWFEFLGRNPSWLSSYAVDLEVIKGSRSFSDAEYRQLEKSRHVVIATFKNGPVSVLAPKEKEETKDS